MNNLPMAFQWRGISSSSVAARTAFVDREPAPPVLYLVYEPPVVAPTPAPIEDKPQRKPAACSAERLFFAVAEKQPTRRDRKQFKYTSAEDAERAARRIVRGRGITMSIWLHDEKQSPLEAATVLRDSLDRVWTQVNAKPGDRAFL